MRRQANLLEFALQSLLRRWQKNVALLLIYALVVAFFASVLFLSQSLQHESERVLNQVPEVWVQKISGGRLEPIASNLADSLAQIRGVHSVRPRIWGTYYDAPSDAVFTIMAAAPGLSINKVGQLQAGQALLGSGYAETHHIQIGQRFLLQDSRAQLHGFKVAGIFDAQNDLLTRDLIVLPSAEARIILGLPENEATDLAVRVTNDKESANIALKINRSIPGVRVLTREQLRRSYAYLFGWKGGLFFFGALMSLLAFLILAWDRASGLSAEEKLELGILKGIGWQIDDVLWLKFWEGFSLSLTAALLGVLLGYIHIFMLDAPLFKSFFMGWSTLYPSYHLQPYGVPGLALIVLSVSVVPYLAATLVPAWRGAITDPAQTMQNN